MSDQTIISMQARRKQVVVAAISWMLPGVAAGSLIACLCVAMNDSFRTGLDAVIWSVWVALIYALAGAGIGISAQILLWIFFRRDHPRRPSTPAGHMVAGAVFCLVSVLCTWLVHRQPIWPYETTARIAVAGLVALLPLSAALGVLRWSQNRRVAGRGRFFVYFFASMLTLFSLLTSYQTGRARMVQPTAPIPITPDRNGHKFVLIGIDGADWGFIKPLMGQGKLPHFSQLCNTGVSASLETILPTYSPIIWTTIATGIDEDKHGVRDFTEIHVPGVSLGIQRLFAAPPLVPGHTGLRGLAILMNKLGLVDITPIGSYQRRVRALWNIFSDYGLRVAVVCWYGTYPVEPVNGLMVSDRLPDDDFYRRETVDVSDEMKVYPHSYAGKLQASLPLPDKGLADPLTYFEGGKNQQGQVQPSDFDLMTFRYRMDSDHFAASIAVRVLAEDPVDFLAVYLSGIDRLAHRMLQRYPDMIPRYYEFTDYLLGRILAGVDGQTTVILVSDHGWGWRENEPFGHFHAPDGVIIMSGRGVQRAGTLAIKPHVRDITPTVLALMGFPTASDMNGRVIREALTPDALPGGEIGLVDSYGPFIPPVMTATLETDQAVEQNERAIERLKGLGYVHE